MTDIKRLGLGCMEMNFSNKERSINTVHEALKGVPRDNYFISVKFGMLPKLGGVPG